MPFFVPSVTYVKLFTEDVYNMFYILKWAIWENKEFASLVKQPLKHVTYYRQQFEKIFYQKHKYASDLGKSQI